MGPGKLPEPEPVRKTYPIRERGLWRTRLGGGEEPSEVLRTSLDSFAGCLEPPDWTRLRYISAAALPALNRAVCVPAEPIDDGPVRSRR